VERRDDGCRGAVHCTLGDGAERMQSANLNVVRVLAPNPGPMTGPGTNTFVVGDPTGALVIDPGCDDAAHLDAVALAGAALGGIQAIVVTHAHPDHMGGAAELAQRTGARVLALVRTPDGVPFADATVADGEAIAAGSQSLTVLATPGHRFDHICLWHAPSGILFAGDLVAGVGTVVIIPPEGDMRAYLASLARVQALPLRRIWPAHGHAIDAPQAKLAEYVAHRLAREAQVMEALSAAGQPQTVGDLVPVVYADTPASMHGWAARSLLAHLIKLEADGRVRRLTPDDIGPWANIATS
jgi:glyoxylase-like metal-dependent hydrolase (beta-lactamase superfamily II)